MPRSSRKTVEEDPVREDRIVMQIVVDAYGPDEQAMGWYCHLENQMSFPFSARCVERRSISPLRIDERVRVIGMADSDECDRQMFVLVDRNDIDEPEDEEAELAVPLSQLVSLDDATQQTREAIGDWHYWVGRGYRFC